jgi:hypothetical protein
MKEEEDPVMLTRICGTAVLGMLLLAGMASAAEVRGVLSKVDHDKKEIVVEGRGKGARGLTFTIAVDKDTRITIGQTPAQLTDLVAGKRVHVFYEKKAGSDVATLIQGHGSLSTPTTAPAVPADPDAMTGVLQRVAFTEREIVVIGPGAKGAETETSFRVPADVKVMRGDKAIAFDDLKEGEQVAVNAEMRDGKLTAVVIHVGAATPTPPRKEEARLQRILEVAGMVLKLAEQMRKP